MLEVVSRKRPTDASFIEKGLNIVGWLNYLVMEDRQREIIDGNCEGVKAETLDALLSVAIQCVSSSPEDWPTMHRVVKTLESEEKVDDCSKFILEVSDNHGTSYSVTQKRKYHFVPGSPNGVIDSYFSSDNSSDSWAVASSVSSSPEPMFKKIRAQEQQMRLALASRVSISTLNSQPSLNFH